MSRPKLQLEVLIEKRGCNDYVATEDSYLFGPMQVAGKWSVTAPTR
jgi:hypothetical protein